jgi:5,10-methylenetetrahydromethanopterin reductase
MDIFLIPNLDLRVTMDTASLLDGSPIDGIWVADSPPTHWRDVYATLALCGSRTSRINLGTGVTNAVTRHPTVTAGAIATVEHLAPGRARLGIGVGDAAVKGAGIKPATLKQLVAYVELVRFWLEKRNVKVPVYLSAAGERTLEMAGSLADGVLVSVGVHPALIARARSIVCQGAAQAGRNPADIDLVFVASLAVSKNGDEAREAARPMAAKKAKDFASHPVLIPEELGFLRADSERIRDNYDYQRHFDPAAPHSKMASDAMIDTFTIAGTPGECREKIRSMGRSLDAGNLGRIVFQPGGGLREQSVQLLVQEVLPQL